MATWPKPQLDEPDGTCATTFHSHEARYPEWANETWKSGVKYLEQWPKAMWWQRRPKLDRLAEAHATRPHHAPD
jgi:hypothetical protein